MKTYNNLFEKICTVNNFKKAYKNATKGKKFYIDVKYIEKYGVNKYLKELLEEVKSKQYKVSKYTIFKIISGGKEREVYKLPMRDRIVQHALMIYLEPIFRETFIIDTYSSIKTRGIHLGLNRVKRYIKQHVLDTYFLKLDIHKCYPSIDKEILKEKLKKKFKDNDLLWLLFTIIDSCEKGLPIGNYTSQYFNNFQFNDFDHWIKETEGIKGYFRYCDDIVIIGNNKNKLKELKDKIIIKINDLNMEVKSNWVIDKIQTRGIDFLGYVIRYNHISLRKRIKKNFINKVKHLDFNNLTKHDVNVLGSYWGILKHCDARHLWFTYTGMKDFKELQVKIAERDFVKNILDKEIIVTSSKIFYKRGDKKLQLSITRDNNEEKVSITTSGECLIEAIEQIKTNDYPFITTIKINDKGYYIFT